MNDCWLGIDTGGTFTDFVYMDGDGLRVHKVLSTPAAPHEAILQGIDDMGLGKAVERGELRIVHGTTVATNAVLEGRGARTVYVANEGLTDVLRIGRQTRRDLYSLSVESSALPVDPALCVGVPARLDAEGREVIPLTSEAIAQLRDTVRALSPEAIAINLLFSFVDPAQEIAVEEALSDLGFVTRSSFVLPEYREYERGVCTWINASLGPMIRDYLSSLVDRVAPTRVAIMQSSGVTIGASQAAVRSANLLLSGPVGGLKAAISLFGDVPMMTFDMGGTSTDVALLDGGITLTSEAAIAGLPLAVPMADIHTIGAGGGSIAYCDAGGLLCVGPASAGASPGPACYGQGGTRPTVTDANLVLGRLQADAFQGGAFELDTDAGEAAIANLAAELGLSPTATALGIVDLANEHMAQALRMISVARGHDPREFHLTCFGGAGGLHLCDLAESLSMMRAIVPAAGGVFSALGMLAARPGREFARTWRCELAALTAVDLDEVVALLQQQAAEELAAEGTAIAETTVSLDLRYVGQTFTLTLTGVAIPALAEAFHRAHEAQYGHRMDRAIELVNVRLHAAGEGPAVVLGEAGIAEPGPVVEREIAGVGRARIIQRASVGQVPVAGPAVLVERNATTLVKAGWQVTADTAGHLWLEKVGGD